MIHYASEILSLCRYYVDDCNKIQMSLRLSYFASEEVKHFVQALYSR